MKSAPSTDSKAALRARAREARASIPPAERLAGERSLATRLLALPAVRRATTFGVYHAAGSELDLSETVRGLRCLDQRPAIAYPLVISKETMVFARFDEGDDLRVLENPKRVHARADLTRVVEARTLDVLLVPGVAFDGKCRRLGQGGGYYDRYLPRLRDDAITIGIAFDEQVVGEVPHDAHDRGVDYVATPTRLIAR